MGKSFKEQSMRVFRGNREHSALGKETRRCRPERGMALGCGRLDANDANVWD